MRIDKLFIEEFKNLKNFYIDFCEQELTSILIGRNGTGKSNVIEALVIIFSDLDLKKAPSFSYRIEYNCNACNIQIEANSKDKKYEIWADGKKMPLSKFLFEDKNGIKVFLPKHIFAYYSGPSNRLEMRFDKHQEKFYRELLNGQERALRPFFYARLIHSYFVLLSFFSFYDEVAKEFLKKYLDIVALESVLFVLKKPNWASKTKHRLNQFWGAKGVVSNFLKDLYEYALAPIVNTVSIQEGFSRKKQDLIYLYLKDEKKLREFSEKYVNNIDFFKNLESMYLSDLVYQVKIKVEKSDGSKVTFNELSEGEQQLITVLGLLKFTKDEESLFLLDEPDTHLNPTWKFEYLQLLRNVVGNSKTSQVIISTHDPIVIGGLKREQVTIFYKRNGQVFTKQPEIDPKGMGVAALLTSELFGLASTLDLETQHMIDRKRELMYKVNKTPDDHNEITKIANELGNLDFTKTIRDPLYEKFIKAVFRRDEFKKPVLSPSEIMQQEKLADEILDKILGENINEMD